MEEMKEKIAYAMLKACKGDELSDQEQMLVTAYFVGRNYDIVAEALNKSLQENIMNGFLALSGSTLEIYDFDNLNGEEPVPVATVNILQEVDQAVDELATVFDIHQVKMPCFKSSDIDNPEDQGIDFDHLNTVLSDAINRYMENV